MQCNHGIGHNTEVLAEKARFKGLGSGFSVLMTFLDPPMWFPFGFGMASSLGLLLELPKRHFIGGSFLYSAQRVRVRRSLSHDKLSGSRRSTRSALTAGHLRMGGDRKVP